MNKHPWERTRLRHAPILVIVPDRVKDPVIVLGPFVLSKSGSWLIAFIAILFAMTHFADSKYEHDSIRAMTTRGVPNIAIDLRRNRSSSLSVEADAAASLKR